MQRALRLLAWMRVAGRRWLAGRDGGVSRTLDRAWRAGERRRRPPIWGCFIAMARRGVSPDPGLPRATGSNGRRARAMAGARRISRGFWATGTTACRTIPERALDLLRAGDARGIAAATHGLAIALLGRGRRRARPGPCPRRHDPRRHCRFSARGQRFGRDVGDRRGWRDRCLRARGGALRGGGAGGRCAWARGTWPICC
jgi:hypothetical protein